MEKPVILCVDDEQIILISLKQQLKQKFKNNYHIETAQNSTEALEIVEELLKDNIELPLVISDLFMPNMRGDELLCKIHAMAPKTLKILLTGQADAQAMGKAINNANLYRYITKPWEPTDFELTVTEAIHSYFQDKKIAQHTQELQRKNEFLNMTVHDLKNPLSAIQGFTDLIKSELEEIPKKEVIEYIDAISIISQQMFDLIKNLLEVNALEAGKMKLSLCVLNVLSPLKELVKHYTERAKSKNIQLHFQYQEQQYNALVDNNSIRQVFDNLISNAIKYSPHGKNIYVRLSQNDKLMRGEIQDEGPGLSDEDQQKLFGQFTRLTPQPTAGEHSTGLGLFIVKKLVEAMHGNVWCESQLGQGTTFIVELPKV